MTPMYRRGVALAFAALALTAVAACKADPAAPAATTAAAAPTTSAATPTTPAADFCANLQTFWTYGTQTLVATLAGQPVPAELGAQLQTYALRIALSVPPVLANDLETYRPLVELLAKQAQAPQPDFATQFATLTQNQAIVSSGLRIIDYASTTCGLTLQGFPTSK